MLTKLHYEGRKSEGEARATWELRNNMPSRPGEFSPARLAFRRERRHPLMPCLTAQGGEEKGRQQLQDKAGEQVRRNSKKESDKFVVGQRVLTQKYTSGNAKSDKSFTLPAKVQTIRPNTHERSAILEFPDGKTTIRDRIHCCIDPSQPQPDIIDNIEECDTNYLKLLSKPQESNGDEQQTIDSMVQKLKAQGEKVRMVADTGDSILIEVISQSQQHSCMKKSPSHKAKHGRFNFQECEE